MYFLCSKLAHEMAWVSFLPCVVLFALRGRGAWLISVWGTKTEDKYPCANASKIMKLSGGGELRLISRYIFLLWYLHPSHHYLFILLMGNNVIVHHLQVKGGVIKLQLKLFYFRMMLPCQCFHIRRSKTIWFNWIRHNNLSPAYLVKYTVIYNITLKLDYGV